MELHNHLIDRLAFVNGIVSGIALYPQVWTVLSTKSIDGVSLLTFLLILLNSLVWLMYSIHRGLISLALASIFNTIASGILVISVFAYAA
jgi:uncharacterized protein with PQ loop repeat